MNLIETVKELQEYIKKQKQNGLTVGFVPTMGFLHEGHVSLIKKANEECDVVVTSIYVNPLQFGPNEDFNRYPRDFDHDERLAREYGTDLLFFPANEEMYPVEAGTTLTVTKRTNVLCGEKRPGHFDGVVTVLTKLFHLVQPDRVYFGQKDAQQVAVVNDLIQSYFFPINLIMCPTVREKDGLAKSSRNVYLKDYERKVAPALHDNLSNAMNLMKAGTPVFEVRMELIRKLNEIEVGEIDYVEILSYPGLQKVQDFNQPTIIALAYRFENARLIDNVITT